MVYTRYRAWKTRTTLSNDFAAPAICSGTSELTVCALRGLRAFVNNELSELEFAISTVAKHFLRPSGHLYVVTSSRPESKVVRDGRRGREPEQAGPGPSLPGVYFK